MESDDKAQTEVGMPSGTEAECWSWVKARKPNSPASLEIYVSSRLIEAWQECSEEGSKSSGKKKRMPRKLADQVWASQILAALSDKCLKTSPASALAKELFQTHGKGDTFMFSITMTGENDHCIKVDINPQVPIILLPHSTTAEVNQKCHFGKGQEFKSSTLAREIMRKHLPGLLSKLLQADKETTFRIPVINGCEIALKLSPKARVIKAEISC